MLNIGKILTFVSKSGAKCRKVPQPQAPRASKLLKKAKKDAGGFREKELVEVDINGKEIFRTITKQNLPTGFGA